MNILQLSGAQLAFLVLPILPNLWCIWHSLRHEFPGEREKYLWMLGGVFLPFFGGIIYVLFGLRRSR